MYQTQASNMPGTAKSILFKCLPVAAALVFVSSAFADCPAPDTIAEKYKAIGQECTWSGETLKCSPALTDEFAKDARDLKQNFTSAWKLTFPAGIRPNELNAVGHMPVLKNMTAKLMPGSELSKFNATEITCNYTYLGNKEATFHLTTKPYGKITTSSYIQAYIGMPDKYNQQWQYDGAAAHTVTCPAAGKSVENCKFTAANEFDMPGDKDVVQHNEFWYEAYNHCFRSPNHGIRNCTGAFGWRNYAHDIEVVANRDKEETLCGNRISGTRCEKLPAKPYCDEPSCKKEIAAMNETVSSIAKDWTKWCWKDEPWQNKQYIEGDHCNVNDKTPLWPTYRKSLQPTTN